jgi:two-component system LytT family sensor kinase
MMKERQQAESERKKVEGLSLESLFGKNARNQPVFMHPAIFVGLSVLLGVLFALQQWASLRLWSYRIGILQVLAAWGLQYFLWGVLCWLLWRWFGTQIQRAGLATLLTRVLPLSVLLSLVEEMIWVPFFPNIPLGGPHMDHWHRLAFELNGDFLNNLVIFWCAVGLFRGVGYYQRLREKEDAAAQLEVQLANAKLSALRMQLNPHFLFNTMNSVSSLMRSDIDAADAMLEQLGTLLRIALERGDAQLIPLRDEVEFMEIYLALQERRYGSRVQQSVAIDPALHDAIVPAMILQPIVENAYAHGLSKLDSGGLLLIEARSEGDRMVLSVLNSGAGLQLDSKQLPGGQGVGLANTRSRLALHYGADHTFLIRQVNQNHVEVVITIPLQFSKNRVKQMTRFGR